MFARKIHFRPLGLVRNNTGPREKLAFACVIALYGPETMHIITREPIIWERDEHVLDSISKFEL